MTTTATTTMTMPQTTGAEMTDLERAQARAAELQKRLAPYRTPTTVPATPAQAPAWSPDESTLHAHLSALGRAQVTFERERTALYRADGTPKYADTEHTERLGALHATLDAAIGAAQEAANTIISTQQTLLAHLEQGDPLDALSAAEQQSAATRKVFIAEDAATLPAADLATRCRVALASGDKPTQYLLARYVGQRVAAADKAGATGQQPEMTGDERRLLGGLVTELLATVRGPQGSKRAEAATALRAKALELRRRSRVVYDAAHERPAALEAQMRATGRYSL